jgi:ABC-type nickel/cobalt efflux system permease component RcnA
VQPDTHIHRVFCLLLGRTKKKIKRLVTLIKVIVAILLFKLKLFVLLYAFGKLMEFKMVLFVGINTLINLLKLFTEWKKSKEPHSVVHYEEAHHEHIHDKPHFDSGDKGWLGGLWSRSDFLGGRSLAHSHELAYAAHRPAAQ